MPWGDQSKPITLRRVYQSPSVDVYEDTHRGRYFIKPVTRRYQGKAPVAYCSYEAPDESVPRYLSGLFKTDAPGVFSGDAKRLTGKKTLFTIRFKDGRDTATITRTIRRRKKKQPTTYTKAPSYFSLYEEHQKTMTSTP